MSQQNEFEASLRGHFLIAMPSLEDPNFSESVTCLCEHTPEGAVGLVINRVDPELTIEAIFEELKLESAPDADTPPVHLGGPVHPGQIPPFDWEACHPVTPSLALSNSKDILEKLAIGQGPESFILAVGCAGWGPGQLESEIMANSWLSCPASETILLMGVNLKFFSGAAGHA